MSKTPVWALFRVFFSDRSSKRFALGVWLGLSFSIAVILSTIGLMDGFDYTLKKGLKRSLGDVYFYSRDGFFTFSDELKLELKDLGAQAMAPHIQTEAFAVREGLSRGISVRGIEPYNFNRVTELKIDLKPGEAVIGTELAKVFDLKPGKDIVLALAKGNRGIENLPLLKRYRVKSIIQHKIYQKDLRLVYVDLKELADLLDSQGKVNVVALKLSDKKIGIRGQYQQWLMVQNFVFELEEVLGLDYRVKPYWYDFQTLLEAVEIEKLTIGLILQIIVVISIFNVLAFIIFLNEKRSQELFLFRALGLSQRKVIKVWFKVIMVLWIASCLLSVGMVRFFNWALTDWSFFQLPGDIYYLGRLELVISFKSYIFVFLIALGWLLFFSFFSFWRLKGKSILYGLRREFI